jgi:F-type H+-transporting ATPase subunit b
MLFDWFTVCAQILNFLVLVWLLRRFLYAPILKAVDEREAHVRAQVDDAAALKAKAEAQLLSVDAQRKEFDNGKAARLQEVEDEAAAARTRLLEAAQKEASEQRTRMLSSVDQERAALDGEFTRMAREGVFAVARKTLTDLGSADMQSAIVARFLTTLHELPSETKATLQRALNDHVTITSAADLPPTDRINIQRAVEETFGKQSFAFETKPDLISGIELRAGGYQVGWNIDRYLTDLRSEVQSVLAAASGGGSK